jgi:glycogen synthase
MKILFITNYYPPCNQGWGYMQLCEEVAEGLSSRGHDLAVLTSTYLDGDEIERPYPVYRRLPIDPDWHSPKSAAHQFFLGRRRRERRALRHLAEVVQAFQPDILFLWHASGLPRVLLQQAERLRGVPVVYYLADYLPELPDEYIVYWQARSVGLPARLIKPVLSRLALRVLAREGKPVRLKYEHAICVSEYVKSRLVAQKLIPEDAVVIHNGVDLARFSPESEAKPGSPLSGLRCLVAGRVVPEKGVHTVVDALALLQAQDGRIMLDILGSGPAEYLEVLRGKVRTRGLQGIVRFCSPVPREQMPEILRAYDVLILPSEYAEPLSRAMQEAMAMGLLVIGTTTGGSGELLIHESTGLAFLPGRPASLAEQLRRALSDPDLVCRLSRAGQSRLQQEYDIQGTIRGIERYLLHLSGHARVRQRDVAAGLAS